ncbi:hypothetical protein BgAZ_103750 [Babesia gibsoni]|uniref:ATP-dependent RNA helicase n=1 Tax=Babesia gibsoni TaxID=33632 RepID=A0AAD8PFR7_BABGI|nr:hypothetical protein BgAZ_103750 [Babesia gibsoni]
MVRRVPISVYNRLSTSSYRSRPLLRGVGRTRRLGNRSNISHEGSTTDHCIDAERDSDGSGCKIHPLLRFALLRSKNISSLNSIQQSSFLSVLSGKDVTIHAPIGSGKTLAYLLPIVNNIYNIHDLLENLQLNSNDRGSRHDEDSIRIKSLGYTRSVPHALLPAKFEHLKQDHDKLLDAGTKAIESQSTTTKLVEALYNVNPKELRKYCKHLPFIPRNIWTKRSKNAIFRSLMSNPLGTVRCCVVVVPNKDLVSHVIKELNVVDPLGRLSVQTLTHVHHVPLQEENNINDVSVGGNEQPFYPSPHTLHYLSGIPKNLSLSMEDEQKMIRSIPTVKATETTVEMVPVNKGISQRKLVKVPSVVDSSLHIAKEALSTDGFVVKSVKHTRRPIINHPVIQYGCSDIIITTPQLFLNNILSTKKLKTVPACVVFDEADFLFENNATRRAMMEICAILRPRPPIFNPLVHERRPKLQEVPPCQFIHVASIMNYGGMQTTGSMLYERFTTSHMISTSRNHYITVMNMQFHKVDSTVDSKIKLLIEVLVENPFAKTIVYVESLKVVKTIYDLLKEKEWPVLSFHSRSSLPTRLAIVESFRKEEVAILVCTDLIARGIEIEAEHIINFDFPRNSAAFMHRIKKRPKKVTNFVEPDNEYLASEIGKVHSINIPANHILSRKRSLKNRRMNVLKNRETFRSHRRVTKTQMRNTDDSHKRDLTSQLSMEDIFGMNTSHMDQVSKGEAIPPLGHDYTAQDHGYGNAENNNSEVQYRRQRMKRRGLDFYNNFSSFS